MCVCLHICVHKHFQQLFTNPKGKKKEINKERKLCVSQSQ